MFVGSLVLQILLFTCFWVMGFDKNSISVEVNHSIKVFICLSVKQGEWSQTLRAFYKWWLGCCWIRKLSKVLGDLSKENTALTPPPPTIVIPPDILLKFKTFSNTHHYYLSLNCKLGEFINHSHAIRDLWLTELVIALFHFIFIAINPKESVPSSFMINNLHSYYQIVVLVKVTHKGEGIPSREGWVTELLLTISFPIINFRKSRGTLF